MVALNFQKQFAAKVESGEKDQTIRALRKDGRDPKLGDRLQLYTGMRTKACRKLVDPDPICGEVLLLTITSNAVCSERGVIQTQENLNYFAIADGFKDWQALQKWFQKTHGLPFTGQLTRW
mgnify:CR=1 FL=1